MGEHRHVYLSTSVEVRDTRSVFTVEVLQLQGAEQQGGEDKHQSCLTVTYHTTTYHCPIFRNTQFYRKENMY